MWGGLATDWQVHGRYSPSPRGDLGQAANLSDSLSQVALRLPVLTPAVVPRSGLKPGHEGSWPSLKVTVQGQVFSLQVKMLPGTPASHTEVPGFKFYFYY